MECDDLSPFFSLSSPFNGVYTRRRREMKKMKNAPGSSV